MSIFIDFVARLFVVCGTISLVEYVGHRYVMHRRKLADLFRSRYMVEAFKAHMQHHFKCYAVFNREKGACGVLNLGVNSATELALVAGPALIALYFDWITAVLFVVIALIHGVMWTAVHTEMHKKENTWFSRTWIFKVLARHHFFHHLYPKTNFNALFLGCDWIFRTKARPTAADWKEMENEFWRVRQPRALEANG
jgi:hypothetical protein